MIVLFFCFFFFSRFVDPLVIYKLSSLRHGLPDRLGGSGEVGNLGLGVFDVIVGDGSLDGVFGEHGAVNCRCVSVFDEINIWRMFRGWECCGRTYV